MTGQPSMLIICLTSYTFLRASALPLGFQTSYKRNAHLRESVSTNLPKKTVSRKRCMRPLSTRVKGTVGAGRCREMLSCMVHLDHYDNEDRKGRSLCAREGR